MIKRVVYTCITKNYDKLSLIKPTGNFDFICFVDSETLAKNCDLLKDVTDIEFRKVHLSDSPQEINRILKIRPHEFIGDYDESIYIDGNIRIKNDPFLLSAHIPEDKSVALYDQPHRDCAFQEIDELVRVGIAKSTDAKMLKSSIRTLGLPDNYGLFEANIIFRRHNDIECRFLMDIWWSLWENASLKRDQPLLAFANFLTNKSIIHSLGYSNLLSGMNPYFYYEGRLTKKNRVTRSFRRLASEILFYKKG
jgi:hypothetical protein